MMKKKLSWFDKIMAAVTFAEANEAVTAKGFLAGTEPKQEKKKESRDCEAILTTDLHGAKIR